MEMFKSETDEEMYERLQKEHEELLKKYDWIQDISKIRRFLLSIFGTIRWAKYSYSTHEDTTCTVKCFCGEEIFINDAWITWCSICGKGYSTLFEVIQYPSWLRRKETK